MKSKLVILSLLLSGATIANAQTKEIVLPAFTVVLFFSLCIGNGCP